MQGYATERSDPQREIQLEVLLRELLDEDGPEGPRMGMEAPPEIAELRDTARRLRRASQWTPLPEGRLAVRQALLVTAEHSRNHANHSRAAWRRAGLWLGMAALAAVAGAFGLGAGALDGLVPPSSPMYGLRLALDRARVAFVPGHLIGRQYPLSYQFSAVQVPSTGDVTRTVQGKVGGLPVTLTLTAAAGACTEETCGKFVVSLARLSTPASTQFGELRGTFACASEGCTLTVAEATGVFAKVSGPHLSVSGAGVSEGQLGSELGSLGGWITTVASVAETLKAGGMLPAGLTVSDLVSFAATNEKGIHHGGGSGGSGRKGVPNTASVGVTQGGKVDIKDSQASGSSGTSIIGNLHGGPSAGGTSRHGATSGGPAVPVNTGIGGGKSGPSSTGEPTVHGNSSVDVGRGNHGGDASVHGDIEIGGGFHGHGGPNIDADINAGGGANVNGGASNGNSGVNAGGGANVNGGASNGNGGANVGGGANVNDGASNGNGGANVGGGASISGGTSSPGGPNAGGSVSGGGGVSGGGSVSGGGGVGGGGVGGGGVGGGGGLGGRGR